MSFMRSFKSFNSLYQSFVRFNLGYWVLKLNIYGIFKLCLKPIKNCTLWKKLSALIKKVRLSKLEIFFNLKKDKIKNIKFEKNGKFH